MTLDVYAAGLSLAQLKNFSKFLPQGFELRYFFGGAFLRERGSFAVPVMSEDFRIKIDQQRRQVLQMFGFQRASLRITVFAECLNTAQTSREDLDEDIRNRDLGAAQRTWSSPFGSRWQWAKLNHMFSGLRLCLVVRHISFLQVQMQTSFTDQLGAAVKLHQVYTRRRKETIVDIEAVRHCHRRLCRTRC